MSKNRHKSRKTNKRVKTQKLVKRSRIRKGLEYEKVKCCICNKEINREDGLMPAKCYSKNGVIRGHRICQECWWSIFAKEGVNHACPGCVKNLSLNGQPYDIIEISD
jgi:hypothetical protein